MIVFNIPQPMNETARVATAIAVDINIVIIKCFFVDLFFFFIKTIFFCKSVSVCALQKSHIFSGFMV